MRSFHWKRVLVQATLLALLVCMIPATSSAAVFISVGFAPPELPIYEQPPCPEDGWLWTPGYWAYGDDGYYWVPGTWVPAPYEGALWTPGYWGWGDDLYVWHPGYWGPHVGYYGGVNYGFGYMGIGFVGGMWAGHAFRYNTAVMRVNTTVIHNTYRDNTIVRNNTIVNDRHVAYSGGRGGINHPPTADENRYSHEQHVAPTSYQTHQEAAARTNVSNYASHNGGHPSNVATDRPITGGPHNNGGGAPNGGREPNYREPGGSTSTNHGGGPGSNPGSNPGSYRSNGGNRPAPENRPAAPGHPAPEYRPSPENRPAPEMHTAPMNRPAAPNHPAPEYRPAPENRPAPESRPAPQPHAEQPHGGGGGGGGGEHDHGKGH